MLNKPVTPVALLTCMDNELTCMCRGISNDDGCENALPSLICVY